MRKSAAFECLCVFTQAVSDKAQNPKEDLFKKDVAMWAEENKTQEKMQGIGSAKGRRSFGQGRPSTRPSVKVAGQVVVALLLVCPATATANVNCDKNNDNGLYFTGPPLGLPVGSLFNLPVVPCHGYVGLNHVGTAEVLAAAHGCTMGSELETSRCVPSVGITHAVRDVPGWTDGERELQTFPTCKIMHEIWLPERRLGLVYPFRPILWEPWLRGCGKVFACKVFEVGFPEDPVRRLLCLGGLWLLALIFFRVEDGGSTKIPNCSECSSLKCHWPSTCHDKIRFKNVWARRDKKRCASIKRRHRGAGWDKARQGWRVWCACRWIDEDRHETRGLSFRWVRGWVVVLLIGRVAAVGQRSLLRLRLLCLEARLACLLGSKCGTPASADHRCVWGCGQVGTWMHICWQCQRGPNRPLATLLLLVLGGGCSGIGIVNFSIVTWLRFAGTLSCAKKRFGKRPTVLVG